MILTLETPLLLDITHTLYIFCWLLLIWGQIPHLCYTMKTAVIILSLFSSNIYYIPDFIHKFWFCDFVRSYHCLVGVWLSTNVFPLRSLSYVSCPQKTPNTLKNWHDMTLTFATGHIISYGTIYLLPINHYHAVESVRDDCYFSITVHIRSGVTNLSQVRNLQVEIEQCPQIYCALF